MVGNSRVAVHEELDLALAPPAGVVDAPGHVGADVLAAALHAVEDRVVLLVGQRVGAAELRVEVGRVLGHLGQRVVDLVVEDAEVVRVAVLDRDAGRACGTASPSSS